MEEQNDYAVALGLGEGFGWRVADQAFWKYWRADKVAMRAAGYRVTRGDERAVAGVVHPGQEASARRGVSARDLQNWSHRRSIARGKGR